MTTDETAFVVTCDFDWQEHGEGDDAALPVDVFTVAEGKRCAKAHAVEFPTHKSYRIWRFDRRYVINKRENTAEVGRPDDGRND